MRVYNADGTLARDSGWGPWNLGTTWFGRVIQGLITTTASNQAFAITVTDTGGVSRTVNFQTGVGNAFIFASTNGDGNPRTSVGWGNGAAAPARTDTQISGVQETFNIASQTADEVNGLVSISGSKVSAVTTNVTRIGLYVKLIDNGTAHRNFLFDHTSVTSTPVTAGQTVAVTYQVSY